MPYFKFVWYLGFPFRYIYWNINKKIVESFIFPLVNLLFMQPLALIFLGSLIKKDSAKVNFMDHVISPYVYSFSRKEIVNRIISRNCEIVQMEYSKYFIMDCFIIKVNK